MHCKICADLGYTTEEGGDHAIARVCSCRSPCPRCSDAGFVLDPAARPAVARPCDCRHLRTRVGLFNQARIPPKMHSRTIENYEEHSRRQIEARSLALRYRTAYQPGSTGLLLFGPPGTGKTHLVCALLRHLTLERGIACRFTDFFHLVEDLRNSFRSDHPVDATIGPLIDADVLAIDEIGKGKASEWEISVCDQLVSRRYNARRTIMATTNFSCGEGDGGAAHLRERVGERIHSRLTEMCEFVEVIGPDFRFRKRV